MEAITTRIAGSVPLDRSRLHQQVISLGTIARGNINFERAGFAKPYILVSADDPDDSHPFGRAFAEIRPNKIVYQRFWPWK